MIRDFGRLGEGSFDLLVVGGGIFGAWIAYDASLRGIKVALVERDDWACGTSSASSKLIHGGLRYLEQARFGLVRKALVEQGARRAWASLPAGTPPRSTGPFPAADLRRHPRYRLEAAARPVGLRPSRRTPPPRRGLAPAQRPGGAPRLPVPGPLGSALRFHLQ
jgi:glycerol-3-phosphate dehydrogenase